MPSAPVAGVTWRPLRPDDAQRLHALLRASEVADAAPFVTSLEGTKRQLTDPEADIGVDSIGAFTPDGRLAAFGVVRLRPDARRRRALGQDGTVHPDLRRRGLGTQVLEWTEARGRERVRSIDDGVPAFLDVWCNEAWAERRHLYEKRGYEPIRYYHDMRRPLAEEIPDKPLPQGLHFRAWSQEQDEAFRQAHNEAFTDHWGSEPLTPQAWQHNVSGSHHFRPDLTVGVYDGDELVGYCMSYHIPEDTEASGRIEGWLGQIGVRRAWRGRGVASAVIVRVMRAMAEAGMEDACLGVDSENLSGAVGLYTALGFRTDQRWMRWAKPV